METTAPLEVKFCQFIAGGHGDPRPALNPLGHRFARCLSCDVIVHFDRTLMAWSDDGGRFHTAHTLQFPEGWMPHD